MNKQTKKQKGGVISINDSSEAAFNKFFNGSTINLFSIGTSGIIFTCTNNVDSDYYAFRTNNLATKVNKIILKLCVLHVDETYDEFECKLSINGTDRDVSSVSENDFLYEVSIQNDVVNNTCGFFEPSAPTSLHSAMVGFDFIDRLKRQTTVPSNTSALLNSLKRQLNATNIQGLKLGLFAMEHAGISETFTTLGNHIDTIKDDLNMSVDDVLTAIKQAEAIAIHEMFIFCFYGGFCHGDHHYGNFLYSSNSPNYFKSADGSHQWYTNIRVLPIDFGRANKLPPREAELFVENLESFGATRSFDNFRNCIDIIRHCGYGEGHNLDFIDQPDQNNQLPPQDHPVYRWFNTQDRDIANYVYELLEARNRAIDQTIEDTRGFVDIAVRRSPDSNFLEEPTKLIVFIIKHIVAVQSLPPPPSFSAEVSRVQREVQQDEAGQSQYYTPEEQTPSKGMNGGLNQLYNTQKTNIYDEYIKLTGSLDLNNMIRKSCFAIISILFLNGNLNEARKSFQTLNYGLEPISGIKIFDKKQEYYQKQEFYPRQVVEVGGTRKRKKFTRKTKKNKRGNKKIKTKKRR